MGDQKCCYLRTLLLKAKCCDEENLIKVLPRRQAGTGTSFLSECKHVDQLLQTVENAAAVEKLKLSKVF